MQSMVYSQYGAANVIRIEERPKPSPKSNELLIRVRACSANDWDLGLLKGDFINRLINGIFRPKKFVAVGSDIAGVVEAVGVNVTQFKPGDRVYGDLSSYHFGGFAEYVCAREQDVVEMPNEMSFAQAAAIPQAGVLATQALIDTAKIKPGQHILINGAGGGVGTLGIQVAKSIGDMDVTGVDSGIKLKMMRELGFNNTIDYTQEDFTKSNNVYDAIIDTKTNRSPFQYLNVLKPNGVYVTVGGSLGRLLQLALFALVYNKVATKQIKIVTLNPNKDLAYYNKLFNEGKLNPVIDGPYRLEQLPNVFDSYGQGLQRGKMVVAI